MRLSICGSYAIASDHAVFPAATNKKIIIGLSIIACIVLVLASLSPVVGFHSVKSNSAISSPLFNVRTKRAINEESRDITSDYVGKGKLWSFPIRDSRTVLVQKFINTIRTMNKNTFDRFIALVINRLKNYHDVKDVTVPEIITMLYEVRVNPEKASNYFTNEDKPLTIICPTGGSGIQDVFLKVLWNFFFGFCMVVFY